MKSKLSLFHQFCNVDIEDRLSFDLWCHQIWFLRPNRIDKWLYIVHKFGFFILNVSLAISVYIVVVKVRLLNLALWSTVGENRLQLIQLFWRRQNVVVNIFSAIQIDFIQLVLVNIKKSEIRLLLWPIIQNINELIRFATVIRSILVLCLQFVVEYSFHLFVVLARGESANGFNNFLLWKLYFLFMFVFHHVQESAIINDIVHGFVKLQLFIRTFLMICPIKHILLNSSLLIYNHVNLAFYVVVD